MSKTITITHNSGFFSCCSVRLHDIVNFINENKCLPDCVDSSNSYLWYKLPDEGDITFEYFKNYENIANDDIVIDETDIDYEHTHQYRNYQTLNYERIIPLVRKYFTPSKGIIQLANVIETEFKLDYENICVLFYRGNDKIIETQLCGYEEYAIHANAILAKNPKIKFLIQSDETEFIEFFTALYPHNSFFFEKLIRHIKKTRNTVDYVYQQYNHIYSKLYLAITLIMSKCKYIICGSGNCSIWIMFFRENANNIYQYMEGNWICPLPPPPDSLITVP